MGAIIVFHRINAGDRRAENGACHRGKTLKVGSRFWCAVTMAPCNMTWDGGQLGATGSTRAPTAAAWTAHCTTPGGAVYLV